MVRQLCIGFGCALLIGIPTVEAGSLHLDFVHEVAGQPLREDSVRYANAAGEPFSVTRMDWLATGFSLTTESGDVLVMKDTVAFVSTRGTTLALPDLPDEPITEIAFFVGPGKAANHADPAQFTANHPLNPNVNNLHWDWQGGYIFLALEGHWRRVGSAQTGGYALHFARDANRTRIVLPVALDLKNSPRAAIALDAGKLLDGITFADGATTHSREGDPVAARIRANFPGAFRVAATKSGGALPESAPLSPIDLPAAPTPYPIRFPRHVPVPPLPRDNPVIVERVELGKRLFEEPALSRDDTVSCASCHEADRALSDSGRFSTGIDGQQTRRHSMPLFNLAWKTAFFWDGRSPSLRAQALDPIQDHLEMDESLLNVVLKLEDDPAYPPLFARAFGSGEISPETIGLAIENYLLTEMSFDSRFDRAMKGQATLTEEEKRGFALFFTEFEPRMGQQGADCFHCHGGVFFTDHGFHNNGLPMTEDQGRIVVTRKPGDRYKFSTPSLRNVGVTAPYMHDGRFATLEEIVAHYNSGGVRSATLDPNLAKHPGGLRLDEAEMQALVAFLKTLTDSRFLDDAQTVE